MVKVIELMVNRHMMRISVNSIAYASVTDKLCKICLDTGETLSLFITISELMDKLGNEDFLRVSRSSLVAYTAVERVNQDEIILYGGARIPFSRSRRKEIMDKARICIERQAISVNEGRLPEKLEFDREFAFWDDVPVGFGLLEIILDRSGHISDFVFRYANRVLAEIEGVSRENLVNQTYGQIFNGTSSKWLTVYSKVAFMGDTMELIDYSEEINKELLVICYQPSYGYCACIVCDATDKYSLQKKRQGRTHE